MRHIHLEETFSTNSYLRELIQGEPELEEFSYVTTYAQTAGRGQRGNSWEAAPGKNISLSLLLRPEIRTSEGYTPFDLNIVTSLSLYDLLTEKYALSGVKVKWPNDILVNERKIAGILTENEWMGGDWEYAIIGIGLNVFQTHFGDYRPQATSIAIESGMQEVSDNYKSWHHALATDIVQNIEQRLHTLYQSPENIRAEYLKHLYRFQEEAPYSTPDGRQFTGTIIDVEPSGLLVMQEEGEKHRFAFKEVQFR